MCDDNDMRIFSLFIVIGLFFAVSLPAKAELLRVQNKTNLKGVYLLKTPNTDRIIVHPVIVAGEADFDGPEGLSHYLEHIMYWHADKVNDKPYHARSGNAWVNGVITSYFNVGTRGELDGMFAFAQRLLTPPTLDEKFMLDERRVVVREYDFRVSENPDSQAWDHIWRTLAAGNPYSRSVIGTPDSIMSLNLVHARSFHRKHYNPSNMVLLITGDLDETEVLQHVERWFFKYPAGQTLVQSWRTDGVLKEFARTEVLQNRYVAFPALAMGVIANWKGTGDRSLDLAVMRLTNRLLVSALDGGLAKPLRLEKFVFSQFGADFFQYGQGQVQFYFSGRLDESNDHSSAQIALSLAIDELAAAGIPKKSLERVRKREVKVFERRSDEARFTINLATNDLSFGIDPLPVSQHVEKINSVTVDQVNGLIRSLNGAHRWMAVHLKPIKSQ